MNNRPSYFGEIIAGKTLEWQVASWQWDCYPALGSCIILEEDASLSCAIIAQIQTGSREQNRTPQPLQKTPEELAHEYPHLTSFLQTTILCSPIGYINNGRFLHQPSPRIPRIHAFIRPATKEELEIIFSSPDLFTLLFCTQQPPFIDLLILAILTRYHETKPLTRNVAIAFAQSFSRMTRNDTFRTQSFITALEKIIAEETDV